MVALWTVGASAELRPRQCHVPEATHRAPVDTVLTFAFLPPDLIPKDILGACCPSGLEENPHIESLLYFCFFSQFKVFPDPLNCFAALKFLNPFRTSRNVHNNHILDLILATKLNSS